MSTARTKLCNETYHQSNLPSGAPHGVTATRRDKVNAHLLTFIES